MSLREYIDEDLVKLDLSPITISDIYNLWDYTLHADHRNLKHEVMCNFTEPNR